MPTTRRQFAGLLLASTCTLAYSSEPRTPDDAATANNALLIVDAQVGVMATAWESARVIANLERLVERARQAHVPVIWVQHSNKDLPYGSAAWQIIPNLVPARSEQIVHKIYNSAFAETSLETDLKAKGIRTITLAGAATNWCIRATAYAAVDRGFNLTLVSDAHTTESLELPDGQSVSAKATILDLNTVFQWLRVPKVSTHVVPTAEVSFQSTDPR